MTTRSSNDGKDKEERHTNSDEASITITAGTGIASEKAQVQHSNSKPRQPATGSAVPIPIPNNRSTDSGIIEQGEPIATTASTTTTALVRAETSASRPGAFAVSVSGRVSLAGPNEDENDDSLPLESESDNSTQARDDNDEQAPQTAAEEEAQQQQQEGIRAPESVSVVIPNAYRVQDHEQDVEDQVQRKVSQQMDMIEQQRMNQKKRIRNRFIAGILLLLLVLTGLLLGLGLSGVLSSSGTSNEKNNKNPLTVRPSSSDPVNGYVWTPRGQPLDGQAENNRFGFCLALNADGSILAVGGPGNSGVNGPLSGHVRIFQLLDKKWVQLGQELQGRKAFGNFGTAVRLSADGTTLAVGAIARDGENGQYIQVYRLDAPTETWIQIGQELQGQEPSDFFGVSLDLSGDGNILAVGADEHDGANGENSGQAVVFHYNSENDRWLQLGQDIDGEAAGDWFGRSVTLSLDGYILAVGAVFNDGGGIDSGHAQVFRFHDESSQWFQIGTDLDGQNPGDSFGRSVSLSADGSILAVGAFTSDTAGTDAGHVRSFTFNNVTDSWDQMGQDLYGTYGDAFGMSVMLSADGKTLAVGADDSSVYKTAPGYAKTYSYNSTTLEWVQIGQELKGETALDWFGYDVALSADGTVFASGGRGNGANGEWAGRAYAFDLNEA